MTAMKERLTRGASLFGKLVASAAIISLAYVMVVSMIFRHSGSAHLFFGKTDSVVFAETDLVESGYLSEDAIPEPPQPDRGCSCPYCCGAAQNESL